MPSDPADLPDDPRAARAVYFDGGCPVCRAEITWYRRMRGADRIFWVDVAADPVPEMFERATLLRRFTITRRDGATVTGAQAFVALWRGLGPTRLLGLGMDRWPLVPIAELAYRAFLRLRLGWRRPA